MGRVLLVEDELLVREVALEDLGEAGFDVTAASDGDEALAIIDRLDPHGFRHKVIKDNPPARKAAA